MNYDDIISTVDKSNARTDWGSPQESDGRVWFLKNNVNIHIETTGEIENKNFQEPWANKHPNPSATSSYYSLYYGSTCIKKILLVSVDGHRAVIPLPITTSQPIVRRFDFKIADIVDSSAEEYLERSGLSIEP